MKWLLRPIAPRLLHRAFSHTARRREIRSIEELSPRIQPRYTETSGSDLKSLQWPSPPRNILLVQKEGSEDATKALIEFAKYLHQTFPSTHIILEPDVATEEHRNFTTPIYTNLPLPSSHDLLSPESATTTTSFSSFPSPYTEKIDLIATFGGDGTILHAGSLFSLSNHVPPILSFSLGTLGFLSEWKFQEYKKAWRELYMSGSSVSGWGLEPQLQQEQEEHGKGEQKEGGWDEGLGASQGVARSARVLMRERLKVRIPNERVGGESTESHAVNELLLHRGSSPHLTHLTIMLNGRPLTTAIADGLLISTPTGSTAYSLSSGGSIVHPLVKGIVVNTVCARSLSFRPLVLPATASIGVKVAPPTRGTVDVSIDGKKVHSLGVGEEVYVRGEAASSGEEPAIARIERTLYGFEGERSLEAREKARKGGEAGGGGGVPCIVRSRDGGKVGSRGGGGGQGVGAGDEGWVDGLNGLLKFNYPFGDEG